MPVILIGASYEDIHDYLRRNPFTCDMLTIRKPDDIEILSFSYEFQAWLEETHIIMATDPMHFLIAFGERHFRELVQFIWMCQQCGAKFQSCDEADLNYWIDLYNNRDPQERYNEIYT
jgi:hypothetical protein